MHTTHPSVARRDTAAWKLQVWISFGIAASLCALGLARLPGTDIDRAFVVMGYVFCLSSAFALDKTLRDAHEADLFDARLAGRRDVAGAE